VARIFLLLKLALAAVGSLLALWFEAVRRTPEVKRRKASRRR
jgi:hypothetical protein